MYIHRIVIDANCINARAGMPEMNELEAYHATGAIEILKTSTLPVEFSNAPQKSIKAQCYGTIGGLQAYIPNEKQAQSVWGLSLRPSLWCQIYRGLFERPLTGDAQKRALRDALHIDQAQMNAVDMFVTNDNALLAAEPLLRTHGIELAIMKPGQCLERIKQHCRESFGTAEPTKVQEKIKTKGPLILGSNSCNGCAFIALPSKEQLLRLQITDSHFFVSGTLRDENGNDVVRMAAGQRPEFLGPSGSVTQTGEGPILVGETACWSFVVMESETAVFAARTTHTGRIVIYALLLRDTTGRTVGRISGETLELTGASLAF